MTEEAFAAAVASTLLPGGKLANGVDAPPAGRLLDDSALSDWFAREEFHAAVTAILEQAGDARAFLAAGPERRIAALRAAEAGQPSSFARLVAALVALYYEHPAVLEAFGWRRAPPEPKGHALEPGDLSLFEPVAARGPVWRKTD